MILDKSVPAQTLHIGAQSLETLSFIIMNGKRLSQEEAVDPPDITAVYAEFPVDGTS